MASFSFDYSVPIAGVALHSGHRIRDSLQEYLELSDNERLYEEDPYTERFAEVFSNRILVSKSRFEVDLNRNSRYAVYKEPEDCWGLNLWKQKPPEQEFEESMLYYRQFYQTAYRYFSKLHSEFGDFVVYDIHSYNHRRNGPEAPPEPVIDNPDINIGTCTIDMEKWGQMLINLEEYFRGVKVNGSPLDVRENIKFPGGHFHRWLHHTFGNSACCISIEFKKIFMDEWTGELYDDVFCHLRKLLASSTSIVQQNLALMH